MDATNEAGALAALTRNLRWAWSPEVQALFREIAPERFRQLRNNPVALLAELPGELPVGTAARAEALRRRLAAYLESDRTWGDTWAHALGPRPVAYFSAEFGIHESLAIYSGGLGVLAGDHLKSASDLGVPLVGVGLFYRDGYFQQRLDAHGWQQEDYVVADPAKLPMARATDREGEPIVVRVEMRTGTLHARVWRLDVGRVKLFLLDTDVEGNSDGDRALTCRLYGGDQHVRIRQELLLGVGGLTALRAAGIRPSVLHLNEGHSAFAALEMARVLMEEEGASFEDAVDRVARLTVFTTHTPVPAGHDRFRAELVEEHLGPLRDALRIDEHRLMSLGRVDPNDPDETFCMTVLALKLSRRVNGVSALHGQVSRRMWHPLWASRPKHEVPIGHITNGVHVPSWLAPEMRQLFDRAFGSGWIERQAEPETWAPIEDVDDAELWAAHRVLKRQLIDFVREHAAREANKRGEGEEVVAACREVLDEDALLIGFARRFATYKRATLVLSDLDRLDGLVNDPARPIQLVFAGKAHPRDDGGKKLLQDIHRATRDPRFAGKVVFLENYDIEVGRALVRGVDVWLNNPRRPLEASGTSGQKVVLNGGLNCSVLDGWWAEAWDGRNGFAIGAGGVHADPAIQDQRDSEDLYRALREEVAPLYYRLGPAGLPVEWIRHMKRSIRTLGWRFGADRMVADYVRQCYLPAAMVTQREMDYR